MSRIIKTLYIQIPANIDKAKKSGKFHQVQAETLYEAIEKLSKVIPELQILVEDEETHLPGFVLAYVEKNGSTVQIDFNTPLQDGDRIRIFSSMAGG